MARTVHDLDTQQRVTIYFFIVAVMLFGIKNSMFFVCVIFKKYAF